MLLCCALLASVCGCTPAPQKEKLHIAVAIPPVAAFVQAVAGDLCTVQTMVPKGYSPEIYAPTPKELTTAFGADVYFSVGVPAEAEAILPHLNPETETVFLDKVCDSRYPPRMIGETTDPHRWLSPKRAAVMVEEIATVLSALDPEHASLFEHNKSVFLSEIAEVEAQLTETLQNVNNRTFLVFHPAFGYFADDFGLEMIALQEDGKEASPRRISELVDLAREEKVRVIFYQEEINSRQAEAFARELSGTTVALDPLSEAYIENLRTMAKTISEAMNH